MSDSRVSPRLRPRFLLAVGLAATVAAAGLTTTGAMAATPADPVVSSITAIAPNHGPAAGGNLVVIKGSNLDRAFIFFGSEFAFPTASSPDELTVRVVGGLAGATVDVTATREYAVPSPTAPPNADPADDYTYDGPTRHSLTASPSHGAPAAGTPVTITGAPGVDLSQAKRVQFGNFDATIVTRSQAAVTVKAPAGTPEDDVALTVTSENGHVDGLPYNRYAFDAATEQPSVTGFSPAAGYARGGQTIRVDGSGLEGATQVLLDGTWVTPSPTATGSVTFQLPPHAVGTIDVRIKTSLGTSANTPADDFTYKANLAPPLVTSISPASVPQRGGTVITIRGERLGEATDVGWFGGVSARDRDALKPVQISDTEIQVTTPAFNEPGTHRLSVVTAGGGGWETEQSVTVNAVAPGPMTISPARGPSTGGNAVTLRGDVAFEWVATASFGGRGAQILSRTDTSLTVEAPSHAIGTGAIELRMPSTRDLAGNPVPGVVLNGASDRYTWVDPLVLLPSIRNVAPRTGIAGVGGFTVLRGTNFQGVTSVKFGSVATTAFVVSGGRIFVVAPPQPKGTYLVTVTTATGSSPVVSVARYTYA